MIMLTLPPSTSLSVTDSQNNTAPDRMKDNMLQKKRKKNIQYFDITTRKHKVIIHFGLVLDSNICIKTDAFSK